jgi:hypothetical protein
MVAVARSPQACRGKNLLFVGGLLNLVGGAQASNIGYFNGSTGWVTPPVTIGADPEALREGGADIHSPNWQGRGEV